LGTNVELLTEDAIYISSDNYYLEDDAHENDAKGWYIIFENQGDTTT
jgi:hypothetical protein